jgi:hypothetical protein
MAKKKPKPTRRDADWAEAKRCCRLTAEEVHMAKELGISPRSLIKNIPSPSQPWKAPVKDWVRELYFEKQEKAAKKKSRRQDELAHDLDLPVDVELTAIWVGSVALANVRRESRNVSFPAAGRSGFCGSTKISCSSRSLLGPTRASCCSLVVSNDVVDRADEGPSASRLLRCRMHRRCPAGIPKSNHAWSKSRASKGRKLPRE